MSDTLPGSEFQYFVSARNALMVISLIGKMDHHSIEPLKELEREVLHCKKITVVIFNLRDIENISVDAIPFLAKFQRDIRNMPAEVRLCGIKPELKTKLLNQGVVRTVEIYDNLKTAILASVRIAC